MFFWVIWLPLSFAQILFRFQVSRNRCLYFRQRFFQLSSKIYGWDFLRILFLYAFVNICVAIAVSKQALHKAHWEIPDCAPLVLPREALKVQIWITYTNFRYFYVTATMDNRKTGCLSIIHVVTITGLRVQGAMLVGKDKSDSLPSLITFRWKKRKHVWHVNQHGRLVTWLQSEYCSVFRPSYSPPFWSVQPDDVSLQKHFFH